VRRGSHLERGEVVQLVWFHPEILPRARRVPAFREVLDAMERRPREPELEAAFGAKDPAEIEDRRDIFEIVARAPAISDDRWSADLADAALEGGRFLAGLVLATGDLALAFDELALLKAMVTVATPLGAGDDGIKTALQDARDFLTMPDLVSPASIVEGFTTRIVEAFKKAKRGLPPSYLEGHAERAMVERRQYQKREVFGDVHLRALLHLGGGARPVPTYLPVALAAKLPMAARFKVRVLAELNLQEDPSEAHVAALRVFALGRVVSLTSPSPGDGAAR